MSIINLEALEKLTSSTLKKWLFRLIYLILGSTLILFGILFITFQTDFGLRINGINLSLMIYIIIILFGLIIFWKFLFTPYYLRRNSIINLNLKNFKESLENQFKFKSFSISRLIAGILFILVGIISIILSSLDLINEINYAGIFILGENSFFYFIGLPAFGIGFSIIIYFIMSPFEAIFSQSNKSFFIYEFRPLFPWITEIPKDNIRTMKYQNNYLGRKLAWILLLTPLIGFQLITAISMFITPSDISETYFSLILMICSILESSGLILLVFFSQYFYEIITEDLLYYMWFSPIRSKKKSKFNKNFPEFLRYEFKQEEGVNNLLSKVSKKHFQLFNLIFGLFLIVGIIFINTSLFLIGPLVFWIFLLYGIVLVVKALNYNFSNQGGDSFGYNKNDQIFRFKRKFILKFQYITYYNVESVLVKKKFRKLELLDISFIGWILILSIAYQIESWIILNTPAFALNNIISTIIILLLHVFIFLYICLPIDQILIKTPQNIHRIEITTKTEGKSIFTKYINNLRKFPKEVLKEDLKKPFMLRLTLLLLLTLISTFSTYSILTTYLL
jgi:hypothetical protein